LRSRQLYGIRFRRQHPIDRFVLDFFCYGHHLAIEVDGDTHYSPEQEEADRSRTERLRHLGVRVIRFTNREVEDDIEGVLFEIARQCGIDPGESEAPLLLPPMGGGQERAACAELPCFPPHRGGTEGGLYFEQLAFGELQVPIRKKVQRLFGQDKVLGQRLQHFL
jgi:very-short-patch-repair endonuclease